MLSTSSSASFPLAPRGDDARAALATMTAALGSPIGPPEIRQLNRGSRVDRLESFLVQAGLSGLRAQAMEGGYDDLASVELPLVLVLRDPQAETNDETRRFTVLHRVDAEEALVGDPQEGLSRLSRAEVETIWTGDVVALTRDPATEEEVLDELRRRRDPRSTAIWLGATVLTAIGTGIATDGAVDGATGFALAGALSAALWSSLKARSCAACDQAAKLVGGLPVAALGAAFYLILLLAWLIVPGHPAAFAALAAAVGVHGALLSLLRRHRLVCPPCLVTAGAALLATGTAVAPSPLVRSPWGALALVLVAAGAWALTVRGLGLARKVFAWRRRAAAFDLARTVLPQEKTGETPDAQAQRKARMIVYKRPGCQACAIFDATLRPGLEETFGEHLTIETRRPEDPALPTPLAVVLGAPTPQIVNVQELDEPFQALAGAVSTALGGTPAQDNPSFVWIG